MKTSKYATALGVIAISTLALFSAGCQKKSESVGASAADVEVIQAKVAAAEGAKKQFCEPEACTDFDLQTVKTNQAWIDDYFLKRLQRDLPTAFGQDKGQETTAVAQKINNQSIAYVRFVGQNNQLATFQLQTYTYAAGAAHGMQHSEYVNFDLKKKKRLALSDILKANVEKKLLEQLYQANSAWLKQHNITPDKLQLSDNYYYGANGIVFVYPLYELASYAEGLTELNLDYRDAQAFVQAEYLPSLPHYQKTA
ncbi:uncharacterized protein DUF3298 [Acinetobacter calcoaceticus]|uniref:Uncharacterized protein DUF3298 n=1 Tax=Acinetobacter calcoaceticus TaxID=471 RepID=A0A4R1Y0U1_ACICA|nr:uncharacterized protein DUF3298 [Acinetobacter calcoaceticus]